MLLNPFETISFVFYRESSQVLSLKINKISHRLLQSGSKNPSARWRPQAVALQNNSFSNVYKTLGLG